jgi:hypothetical protein
MPIRTVRGGWREPDFSDIPYRWVYQLWYDVTSWLGFSDADEYLEALPKERERIFERAKE